MPRTRTTSGLAWFLAAAVVGLVHAGFSAYWALGGRWLLDTVGQWATDLVASAPLVSGLALGVVALAKAAGALVPVLVESGRIGGRRFWRGLETVGAVVLVLYGVANAIVAWAVLGGLVTAEGGYNRPAELGHAALWDPLFTVWGALLLVGLWRTRSARAGLSPGSGRGSPPTRPDRG